MFHIDTFDFNLTTPSQVSHLWHDNNNIGVNWPVVYVINNDKEAYVGETVSVSRRIDQHLQNEQRQKLTEIRIISDKNFNKSVALDLESFLIKYMASDEKFILQNGNNGIHDHNYYNKLEYRDEFRKIWNKLRKMGVVNNTLDEIEQSELYKYSPYKSLGEEQKDAVTRILKLLAFYKEDDISVIVRGGAGTGKTIVAIYLMKYIADLNDPAWVGGYTFDDEIDTADELEVYLSDNIHMVRKIGLVVPQKSLKSSLQDVFNSVRLLDKKMVLTPAEVVDDYKKTGKRFDLLIVDEAHRLRCRYHGNVSHHPTIINRNKYLGLDERMGTELDWIMLCSRNQIFFRDERQTVRPCDLTADDFMNILRNNYQEPKAQLRLDTQWRCQGGDDYIEYLRDILWNKAKAFRDIPNYDLKLYTDCNRMYQDIQQKNEEFGLCRMAAGFAWPWDRNNTDEFTIHIQGHQYRWNRKYDNWISSETAPEEIGCIHTLQGYDLNYAGIIIGEDLKYNPETQTIVSDKTSYFDTLGKAGVSDDPEALKDYLCNIYLTLLTRGIKGTYIYICDDALREYFSQFIPIEKGESKSK